MVGLLVVSVVCGVRCWWCRLVVAAAAAAAAAAVMWIAHRTAHAGRASYSI